MITNVYIVSHLYGRHFYQCILWAFCACLEEAWVYICAPTPCGIRCHCSTSWCSFWGNVGAWKGYKSCTRWFRISQWWLIANGWGFGWPVKRVWHNQLANSSLSYCRYGGILLLEGCFQQSGRLARHVGEDLIHIALAYKWAPNYYAN